MILKQRSKIVIDSDDVFVKNDSLIDTIYHDGKFIGTSIAKVLDFTALNNRSYAGKEVVYFREEYIQESGSWHTTKIGTFIVTDIQPDDNEYYVKVTAYDYMLKTAIDYIPQVDFPATLQAVYEDLLTQCGLEAESTLLDINGEFVVSDNQFDGETCQTVLGKIAEITGNYAHINPDDKVVLQFHSADVKSISAGDYSKFINKRDTTPITVLIMDESYSEGEELVFLWNEGVELYGENSYKISDNGFCNTDDKKNALAPAILEKIKGFGYAGFELRDAFTVQNLNCGDLIDVSDNDGTITRSIVLSREFTEKKSILKASSYVKASVNYNTAKRNPAIKAMIEVDKANGRIDSLVSETLPVVKKSYIVDLSSSIFAINTDSRGKPVNEGNFAVTVSVRLGDKEVNGFTLSTTDSHTGIAVSFSSDAVTFSWGVSDALEDVNAYNIFVDIDGTIITRKITLLAVKNGEVPYIEDGTWHIGDEDTGVLADWSGEIAGLRGYMSQQYTSITQDAEQLALNAVKKYAGTDKNGNLISLSESVTQMIKENEMIVEYKNTVDALGPDIEDRFEDLKAYLRYGPLNETGTEVGIEMGSSASEIKVRLINDKLVFYTGRFISADADNVIQSINAKTKASKIGNTLQYGDDWEHGVDSEGNFYHAYIGD